MNYEIFDRSAEEEKRHEINQKLALYQEDHKPVFLKNYEDYEKDRILEDLKDRVNKVVELEMKLDEMAEKIQRMEYLLEEED